MGNLPFETLKREIWTKKECETSDKFGCKPEDRPAESLFNYGIINIDKPKGPTSHQVSAYVQKILNIKKSGHSGTLDPKVTGVLPTALGKSTRAVQVLLIAGKEYVCLMHLHHEVPEEKIREEMQKFVGKIRQMPPIKSAVKRQWRYRNIYYIDILDIQEKDVLFRVGCQAGTYIRKLCLHPETQILTTEGTMNAKQFYSKQPVIYSYNKGKLIKKKPTATQKISSPKKLIKITMSSGISFTVTPDHELLVSTKDGYVMKEAGKLTAKNYLVKSKTFPKVNKKIIIADLLDDNYLIAQKDLKEKCKKAFIAKYGSIREMHRKIKLDRKAFLSNSDVAIYIKHLKLAGIYDSVKQGLHTFKTQKGTMIKLKTLNKDFFYLLGLIASDGNNTKEKKTARFTRIKFHNTCEDLIFHFIKKYKKLFPNIPISKKGVKNIVELDTANSFLATIAASLGIKSPQKNSDILPILDYSPTLLKAFLKGYFDGDGSAYYKKKVTSNSQHMYIRYHTVNYKDAISLHKMLLKVGIPNKIFFRKNKQMFDVSVEGIAAMNKFIKEIGSNHPFKLERFDKILDCKYDSELDDHYYMGFHFKKYLKTNKSKLRKLGGNINRVLTTNMPITKGLYASASKLANLPKPDDFIIEQIKSIELTKGTDYVYDMTVPGTHNFLIESGFVSSNCHDMGQKMGTGAHMAELRRTKAGPFMEDTATSLQDLTDAFYYYKEEGNDKLLRHVIKPIEFAVQHLAKVWVMDTAVETICQGADLAVPGICKVHENIEKNHTVAIMTLKGELIALGEAKMGSSEMIKKDRGIAVKTRKVFLPIGTYPKIQRANSRPKPLKENNNESK